MDFYFAGRYASFEQIRVYEVAYQGCLAGVLFIITLDLLKPLEFNYHFFMLTSALKIARTAICAFLFIIVIEVIAFSSLLNLTIGNSHELFKSMQDSMNTLLTVLLAMMSYTSEHFNDIVTKLYFGLYTMTVTITLVNVFIVILTISFNDVKTEIEKGNLYFDEKLNIHFWNKIHAGLQWIQDRLCFSCKFICLCVQLNVSVPKQKQKPIIFVKDFIENVRINFRKNILLIS